MKNIELKEKLHHFIETAQEKKLKAIYSLVGEEIEESYNKWGDVKFIKELQKREQSYLNGTASIFTIEQSVAKAKKAVKNKIK
jgi:hypothetical protein